MNAHVFIDAENIPPEIGFRTVAKFRRDYTICRADIIGKRDTLSAKYLSAGTPYHFQNCFYGKNSADTWLCVEIAKTIFQEPEIEAIIIVSSDRDFLPAIKLAVEKKKIIILVSNGEGHKNFQRLLRELKINLADVRLVDYRDGLELTDTSTKKKKKSLADLMKDATPTFVDTQESKLKKFYQRMLPATESFFRKREDQVKIIFIKYANQNTEIPFIDGMNLSTFTNILRELRITGKKTNIENLLARNLLYVKGKKVYQSKLDENIAEDSPKKTSPFDNLSSNVVEYFTANNSKVKIIFVKRREEIIEVPFVEGMNRQLFLQMMFEKKVIEQDEDFEKVLADSFLKISSDKIYFNIEEEKDAEEDFSAELENMQTVFINFAGELIEVPFFEGIACGDFFSILSYFGIVGDSKFMRKVIKDSMLTISGDKVYFAKDEEFFSDDAAETLSYLSTESLNFISANETRLKFVNMTYEGFFYEIPFISGMTYAQAAKILLDMDVITKFEEARKALIGNGFRIINGSIYR